MATPNMRLLLAGLQAYDEHLHRHVANLEAEYQALEQRWYALNSIYDGDGADQFRAGWQRTTEGFAEYKEQVRQIADILSERIEHLKKAEQAESNF